MRRISLATLSLLLAGSIFAGNGTEAGHTLLETPSARPAALGDAFSAARNDVTAFAYNPASLGTLEQHQASFLYEKGPFGDAYSQASLGLQKNGGWGLSMGFYDSGVIAANDGASQRNVTGQKDFALALGYGRSINKWGWGISGKYLSSTLVEQDKAEGLAGDAGLQFYPSSKLTVAAGVQNMGPSITYMDQAIPLNRLARLGAAWAVSAGRFPTLLYVETPYQLESKRLQFGSGVEVGWSPLVFRVGYKSGSTLEGLSMGMGFQLSRLSLDYSFGWASELSARHRLSAAMRFGSPAPDVNALAAAPERTVTPKADESIPGEWKMQVPVVAPHEPMGPWKGKAALKVYEVKPGDTVQSIAKFYYGREDLSGILVEANRHLISDPNELKAGMKLVVP